MSDQINTIKQLEAIFKIMTLAILDIPTMDYTDPDNPVPINQSVVRTAWPFEGAPGWGPSTDMISVQVVPNSNTYNEQRDLSHAFNSQHDNLDTQQTYLREHFVKWIIYGPAAYENAEELRNGLYLATTLDYLTNNHLAPVLDIPAVVRMPELFNGQWWNRCDLSCRFNEQVVRHATVPYLIGTNIQIIKNE